MTLTVLPFSPLVACLTVFAVWGLIGIAGLIRPMNLALVGRVLFPASALSSLFLAWCAWQSVTVPTEQLVLGVGLPDLPVHLRRDGLASVFLLLLGVASAGISTFAGGYFRQGEGTPPGLLCLHYHLFLCSMGLVLLADDAYAFMVAWETMALTSYFLVTTQHRIPEIRQAGFIYLLMAHLGALSILLSFGVLQGNTWQFTFDAMRGAHLSPYWSAIAFLLALVGFGGKAGLVPLHVWLPEAHPAAPSPVSALLSGVMLKTAIYGMLRVTFDLLHGPAWWLGLVPLTMGLFSAIYGVVFAAVQTDMKRLLAYSSIENIGLIFTALGLAIVFFGVGMRTLGALTLIALLYHCVNHALMKSLLFLGTGAVLHATGERNLGHLGGLIHRMPWVAWLMLVGVLAIAGLPPLNGFVSEWLLLQTFLFANQVPVPFVNMLLPMGAAVVALSTALAGYVMVKFFGVIFLGQMREPGLAQARDCSRLERIGLAFLATGCVVLGLLPARMVAFLDHAGSAITGTALDQSDSSWWMLVPIADRTASYGPITFLAAAGAAIVSTVLLVRWRFHRPVRRADAWDGGYGGLNPRMQDTAEGFGYPIRHIFEPLFDMHRELPSAFDTAPRYLVTVTDRCWRFIYEPIGAAVQRTAGVVARLQQGQISVYLMYSFIVLVVLLAVMS